MPDFPVIDAHVHLYDPTTIPYPWMTSVPLLDEPHLTERFFSASAPVDVEALVFVEVNAAPDRHVDEALFVTDLAASEPRIRALVAQMPLDRGESVLDDLERYAAMPLARGVRTLLETHAHEPGWALRERFVAAVRRLPDHALSFDLCLRHAQMPEAIELVRRCPDVRFVLDHLGKPPAADGAFDPWRAHLTSLAAEPNVWCKISGLLTEADHRHWTYEGVAPYIDHVIDTFGFDRVMYGGDWPVSRLASSYADWVEVLDRVVLGASDDERRRLYRDNAIAFYRIEGV